MRLLALLLLFIGCDSSGQGMVQRPRFTACGFADPRMCARRVRTVAPLFQFQNSAPIASQCSGATFSGVTFSRATAATCQKNDLTLVALTSGQPSLEGDGLRIEPAATNKALHSEAFDDADWTTTNATVTANTDVAPDGTTTADTLTDDATSGVHKVISSVSIDGNGSTNYVASVYAKAGTASFIRLFAGATAQDLTVDLTNGLIDSVSSTNTATIEPAANGFWRISTGKADVVGPGFLQIFMGDTAAHARGSYSGTGKTIILWGAQNEALGTTYPTSYVKTVAAAVTRNATTATISNSLTGADWCVRARVAPDAYGSAGHIWTRGTTQGIFQIGATQGNANTADAWVGTTGLVLFHVYDASGTVKTFTSTYALGAGQHDLRFCANSFGALVAYDGATSLAGGTTGSGNGAIATMPASIYLGSNGAANYLAGRIMDVCVVNSASGCISAAADVISPAIPGAGTFTNPFVPNEPDWCVKADYSSSAEMAGSGTLAAANSWTLTGSANKVISKVYDARGLARIRTSVSTYTGTHTAKVCSRRGEQFIFVDDTPVQAVLTDNTGSGFVQVQASTIRLSATGCISRYWGKCGTVPKLFAALGDSLTTAPAVTTAWPAVADGDLPSAWDVRNYAVGGTTIAEMRDNQWRAISKQGHSFTYVSVMGGINETNNGATGADTYAILLGLMQDIEATGATVILITPTPWKYATTATWDAGKQTEFTALLTAMRGSGRILYDANPVFAKAGEADALEPTYNIDLLDGVHLNQAAQTIIGHSVSALVTP